MTRDEQAVRHPGSLELRNLENNELLKRWQVANDEAAHHRETAGRIEMELARRMEEDQATEVYHSDYTVKIEDPTPEYDQGTLYTAKEYVPLEVWEGLYTPPALVEVPAKINMTKLKAARKYDGRIGGIVETAKLPAGPGRLRIRRRS